MLVHTIVILSISFFLKLSPRAITIQAITIRSRLGSKAPRAINIRAITIWSGLGSKAPRAITIQAIT